MYIGGEWYLLGVRDSILASYSLAKSVADTLDVSILAGFSVKSNFRN